MNKHLFDLIRQKNFMNSNEIAKQNIKRLYDLLLESQENKDYRKDTYHTEYIKYIIEVYPYLQSKDYINVCDRISEILHFNNNNGNLWQKREKYILLKLLNDYFIKDYAEDEDSIVLGGDILYDDKDKYSKENIYYWSIDNKTHTIIFKEDEEDKKIYIFVYDYYLCDYNLNSPKYIIKVNIDNYLSIEEFDCDNIKLKNRLVKCLDKISQIKNMQLHI